MLLPYKCSEAKQMASGEKDGENMSETVLWIVLAAHICLCILYYFLIKINVARLTGTALPIMLIVPLFGPVSILLVEWILIKNKDELENKDEIIENINNINKLDNYFISIIKNL